MESLDAILKVVLLLLLLIPSHTFSESLERIQYLMGTTARVRVWAPDSTTCDRAIDGAFRALTSVDREMSTYRGDSQLSMLNAHGSDRPVPVGEPLLEVLRASVVYREMTSGAFDPSVYPLVHLWGFRGGEPRLPSSAEIEQTLRITGVRFLVFEGTNQVRLSKRGASIDLGGIAKGYALDAGKAAALEAGALGGLIDLGGNLLSFGVSASGYVGVQDPDKADGIIGRILLQDGSAATSGGYEKYVEIDGKRYGHIIDPRTGWPSDGMESVTVVARQGMAADALSTACYVLGPEDCLALVESQEGVECVVVWEVDGSVRVETSDGIELLAP